ncbi:MAG: tetratricopeptide repeat protein [Candidatus Delongbacteria bacterium]|nr:tetratricopeptide repeat protein [Candidatus Delongbacteria bacterium]
MNLKNKNKFDTQENYFEHKYDKSIQEIQNTLKLSIQNKNKHDEAVSLINYGGIYFEQKNYAEAEKHYIKALNIIKKEDLKLKEPGLLKNLGLLKIEQYDFLSALDYFLQALKITPKSNKRVLSILYHSIGYSYASIENYNDSMKYLKKALKIREELKLSKGITQTLNRIGLNYYYQSEYKKALKYLNDSFELKKKNKESKKSICSSLNNLMVVYHKKGEFKKALETGHQALKIFEDLKLIKESSFVLNNLGLVYYDMALYSEALKYQFKSLKIKERSNNLLTIANSLSNIGSVFNKLVDYDKALEYESNAIDLRIKMNSRRGISDSYNNLGNIYQNKKDFKKALDYYKKSLNIRTKDADRTGVAETLKSIGMLYLKLNDHDKALEHLHKSMKIIEELGEKKSLSTTYINIAKLYFTINDYKHAEEYSKKSFNIAKKYDHKDVLQDDYELMSQIYSDQRKYKKSLECYKKFINIHDEILNIQKQNEIFNMYLKHENEKKEKENEIYKLKNIQLIESNEKLRDSRKELQRINASKDRFFNILAHDLKNPFSILYTTSEILASYYKELSETKRVEYISTIRLSSKHILKLIENLLEWSRSQSGKKQFQPVNFNLYEIVESTFLLLNQSAKMKNISMKIKMKKNLGIYADKNMIRTVLRNLITNSIKFTNKDGNITISSSKNKQGTTISVHDDGVGIKKKDQKKLFSMDKHFVTMGTSNEKGTGIGLLLCEEFVKKHNGKIWIESKYGKGSKFTISIPLKF